jgi:hypothetical protein
MKIEAVLPVLSWDGEDSHDHIFGDWIMKRSTVRKILSAIEPLDARRMLAGVSLENGVLGIECTEGRDRVSIVEAGETTIVESNIPGMERLEFFSDDITVYKWRGGSGPDRLSASTVTKPVFAIGGGGADIITTGAGNDTIAGGGGNDRLRGGDGSDLIGGMAGRDRLYGQAGDDVLVGGSGRDRSYGDVGEDAFFTRDRRADFAIGGEDFDDIFGPDDGDEIEEIENRAPVATADTASTDAGRQVVIDALLNDNDPDDDVLEVTSFTQAANGSVTLDEENGLFIYAPNAGFVGTDSFTYTIDDGTGATSTAMITIQVLGTQPDPGPGNGNGQGQQPGENPGNGNPGTGSGQGQQPGENPNNGSGNGNGSGQTPVVCDVSTRLTVGFVGSRHLRGDELLIEGVLRDQNGRPVANQTIRIQTYNDQNRGSFRTIGHATTNRNGKYSFRTVVPTSAFADNNYYRVVFSGSAGYLKSASDERRLPISRP